MGERKVMNEYIPWDFDPAKIPRRRQPKNHQVTVRTMLPVSIRCNTCGDYVCQGTKSNSRKEGVIGERCLGRMKIYRLYSKCTRCSSELRTRQIRKIPITWLNLVQGGILSAGERRRRRKLTRRSARGRLKRWEMR